MRVPAKEKRGPDELRTRAGIYDEGAEYPPTTEVNQPGRLKLHLRSAGEGPAVESWRVPPLARNTGLHEPRNAASLA